MPEPAVAQPAAETAPRDAAPSDLAPPVPVPLAEVTRGGLVESLHLGAVAVVRPDGTVWTAGPADEGVWMRSAVKPFQAIPLVELGIADALGLGDAELALCCASHSGTDEHVAVVARMLAATGLSPDDLQCGPHAPFDQPASLAIARGGGRPTRLHNNCSGKHTGFLLLARHLGDPLDRYLEPDSAAQRTVRATVADLAGLPPDAIATAVDGCGAPTLRLPLTGLARAFHRYLNRAGLPAVRAAACERLLRAATAEPVLVAGDGRLCTALLRSAPGRVHPKNGAEGVYGLGAVGRHGAFAVAVKVLDGAERGYLPVVVELCRRLGLWDDDRVPESLQPFAEPAVLNTQKRTVGSVRQVLDVEGLGGWGGEVRTARMEP